MDTIKADPLDPSAPQPDLRRDVEALLFREARTLDGRRYHDWLALWHPTEPLRYWVPCNEDDYDPTEHISLIFDDRQRLQERVARLESPAAHAQDPPSRTVRVVSNIEIERVDADRVTVHSAQAIGEFRNGDQTSYYSRTSYALGALGARLYIQEKTVLLVNNDGYFRNLSFLL